MGLALAIASVLGASEIRAATPADTEAQAERYVRLALALDRIREGEVDAWFGPAELSRPGPDMPGDLRQLDQAVARLADDLAVSGSGGDEERRERLRLRVHRLADVTALLDDGRPSGFYEEAASIYGVAPPTEPETARWHRARAELDALLPGEGPLAARGAAFRAQFVVPVDRRRPIFERALAECRARTLEHWRLPPEERLDVVWSQAIPAAWHRYEGGLHSVLQINRQALAMPGQAMDLACHEGYPGHHAQFVVADMAAGPDGPQIEDRLSLLRSPESVIREGAADAGVELAFPAEERLAFLRDVIFPLAGFDPADAARYARYEALERAASGASLPILARYHDGALDRDQATAALVDEAFVASPGALLDYTDHYGAYLTGYTIMRDRTRTALGSSCGGDPWEALRALVERPHVPSACRQAASAAAVTR
jgi:hypothetical protein